MTNPENREQELRRKELELQAKEQEIRLRELETQIYQEQRQIKDVNHSQPPLYKTRKHQPPENALRRFSHKVIKLVKFAGFVIIGITFIRVGCLLGMWIAYLAITGIIAFIGYQIFLNENEE